MWYRLYPPASFLWHAKKDIIYAWIVHPWTVNRWIVYHELAKPHHSLDILLSWIYTYIIDLGKTCMQFAQSFDQD